MAHTGASALPLVGVAGLLVVAGVALLIRRRSQS
ncbi:MULTISPECIES: LPXTG cell wall anchor domain-containing protein [Rothia]